MARRGFGLRGVSTRRVGDPVSRVVLDVPEQADGASLAALVAEHGPELLALVAGEDGAVPVVVRRGAEEIPLPRGGDPSGETAGPTSPVMTRLDEASLRQLDLLVGGGVCRSRSEAVAWCVRRTLAREGGRIAALRAPVEALRDARAELMGPDGASAGTEVRRVLALAEREARRRGHGHVGTEHLILALLALEDGPSVTVLGNLGVSVEAVAAEMDHALGTAAGKSPAAVPLTPRACTVVQREAPREAARLGAGPVGALHLLLALAALGQSAASRALAAQGASAEALRAEARRLLTQN